MGNVNRWMVSREASEPGTASRGHGDDVGPNPSQGSRLHGQFDEKGIPKCRPCVWMHKETGCAHGYACTHCHLCPEGEAKTRTRQKRLNREARLDASKANLRKGCGLTKPPIANRIKNGSVHWSPWLLEADLDTQLERRLAGIDGPHCNGDDVYNIHRVDVTNDTTVRS